MAMNTNTAPKFENISSKVPIHSGSPTLYQLTPKEDKIGTLKRMTLGKKDPNKTNKTILLVGETGSGKSTLINALVNYAMGVEWEDDVWFQIVEEEKKSQSKSQTSDVIVYEIFDFEGYTLPYSLTIIDTPGYGNTEGIENDVIVRQRLFDLFRSEDGVHEINVVGLVLKASENRLDERLRYIFDSVVDLFGKDMEKNIVALFTHSNGKIPKDALGALKEAKIKCAENEKKQPVHFLFDNCQHEDRADDEVENTVTKNGMKKFTNFLGETEPQKLETTVQVLNERVRLTACIQNLQQRVELLELKQRETQQTEEGLKKHEEEMKSNAEFTVEVDEPYKEIERIDAGMWGLVFYGGATCCNKCEENCHYPGCTMAWSPNKCEVMTGGRDSHCTSCSGKCPVSDHVKENWKYVTKTRKVKKTLQDLKDKYDVNKAETGEIGSILERLQKQKENLEAEKTVLLHEAYQHVMNLEQIALNVVSLSTYVHLDFLIEEMQKKKDTEKVKTLKKNVESRRQSVGKAEVILCSTNFMFQNKKREYWGLD